MKKVVIYIIRPAPYDTFNGKHEKIGNYTLFKRHEVQRKCQPLCMLLSRAWKLMKFFRMTLFRQMDIGIFIAKHGLCEILRVHKSIYVKNSWLS